MENDKKAYREESEQMLKRQANMIEKLKDENKSYCKEMLKNNKEQKKVAEVKKALGDSYTEISQIKDKIEKEVALHKQLDDQMKTVQKTMIEKKRMISSGSQSGLTGGQNQTDQNSKKIKILENRLEKANQKFNETIAQNKVMREEIDNLRKEKVIFENLYSKLDKQVQQKRSQMNDIMEIANNTYEERDKIQEKLAGMITQSEKEQAEFDREIKAVQDLIEKDDNMQNKINVNVDMNQIENKRVHEMTQSMGRGVSESSGATGVAALKDPNSHAVRTLKELKNQKIDSYEEAFTKIMSATGITDLNQLTKTFIQAEEKNFAMFKFVNELNSEIENFETQIFEMQSEIDRNLAEGGQDS